MYGSTALKAPTGEPIFPPELRKRTAPELSLPGPLAAWYRCGPIQPEKVVDGIPKGRLICVPEN